MCTSQGSFNNLLQCIVNLINTSHSDKPDFSKRSLDLLDLKRLCHLYSLLIFSSHTLKICFKIQGMKMTPHLICPLPVSWCIVDSWQTCEELLQCSHSDFFRLFSEILGHSSFPVCSFGVLYWARDQSTRVTCKRAQSSMRNSWCMFMLSPSPQGDECAQLNIFLWNYFKYCANKRESRVKEMILLFSV